MDEIMVSVRCITFNHAKYIRKALDGFLMQKTNFRFEVVVHDDASTDGTREILQEYQEKHPDLFRLILQEKNQYSQGNRVADFINPQLRGKYVALCEGDDYWTDETKLQRQVDYLEAHPECALAAHQAVCVDDEGILLSDYCAHGPQDYDVDFETLLKKLSLFPTASMMFRRSFFTDNAEILQQLPTFDYVYKLMLAGMGSVHIMVRSMSAYRVAAKGSWTVRIEQNPEKNARHLETSVKALSRIDDFYDHRYTEALSQEIRNRNYEILECRGDYPAMRKGEFREIYMAKGRAYRFQMYVKYHFPALYAVLKRTFKE